jgi:trigger factor
MVMQVTVEDLSSVKKMLHIEIPQDEVNQELESAYKQLKKTAKIKGFRPGKVPRSVLVRMFKKDIHADVCSRLIQASFVDALKETELNIVGNPQLDPPDLIANESYRYDAAVEIKPDINDIDFKGLTLKKTLYKVDDTEIDAQLKGLQKKLARQKPIEEERAAREGDTVIITYEGLKDGKPFAETQKTENFTAKIGDGAILADFDSGLIGMNPGETKEINVTFPKDYFNQKLANIEIDFQVTLNEIREEEIPEIDDKMAKELGNFQNLDELKDQISKNLEQGYDKRIEQEMGEQIYQALIEKTDFEVPDTMVDYELEAIVAETERSFAYRNTSLEDMGLTREGIAEKYRNTAVKQVRRHLVLDKIIRQEDLELSDEEMDAGYADMAEAFGQPQEEIKNYYSQNKDKLEFFKHTLLEKKAVKLIIDNSTIEEIEPSDQPPSEEKKDS